MKVTYDKDGNIVSVEDDTIKWACLAFASMWIGIGLALLSI
jgi:hypothetical protein